MENSILTRIQALMKEKKITQRMLCNQLNLPESQFSNWKTGQNSSYLKLLPQIAEVLQVNIVELYGIENKQEDDLVLTEKERNLIIAYRLLTPEQRIRLEFIIANMGLE